jgi:hypothetical protein
MVEQAKEAASEVASTAADEARGVAHEAAEQVRSLADQMKDQVEQQSQAGLERLAGTVATLAEDLAALAEGRGGTDGLAADLVRQASDRARTLGDGLQDRSPGDLLGQVEDFARRRPGAFLLGAAVTGVLLGRMTRGAVTVDLREPAAEPSTGMAPRSMAGAEGLGMGVGSTGATGIGNGPGSLGAEAVEAGLVAEAANAPRSGAGRGLAQEQRLTAEPGLRGDVAQDWPETPATTSAAVGGGFSTADDDAGGTGRMAALDDAIEEATFGTRRGPEVQP